MMAPEFEKAAMRLEPGMRLLKLDTEAEPEVAARFGIRSIPTLVLFADGREVARTAGAMNAASLVSWVAAQAA
jgi:thioredoxin 2